MSVGTDLLLDPITHDLAFFDGTFQQGVSIAQLLKIRMLRFRGEWFLNREKGIPYLEEIFIKGPLYHHLVALYRDVIINTPGVTEIDSLDLALDVPTRQLSITFSADTIQGELAETVVVPI